MNEQPPGRSEPQLSEEPAAAAAPAPAAAIAPAAPGGTGGFGAKLRRLGSESLIYGLSSILGRFLNYLLTPFYAHEFTTAQNGVQSVVYTYIPIVAIPFLLGLDIAYMRQAAGVRDAEPRERQRAFSMSFGAIAGIGGTLTLLGMLVAPWAESLFRLPAYAIRYILLIVFTDALLAVPWAHLRMTNRAKRFAFLRLTFVALNIALNVVLIARLRWGVEGIFLANLVSNLVLLALVMPEILRLFRPALMRSGPWRALWAYALPIMPATLAVMLVENADRLVLNYLPESLARAIYGMSSKQVVGVYSFNYKLGVFMLLVVQMFRMAWTPFSLTQGKQPGAPQLFSRVLTALMLVCGAVFLGVTLFLPPLVAVPAVYRIAREPAYWLGLPIVPVILLGYVFSGAYAVVTAGLYIERRTGVLPWIAGAGALLNIGICVFALRYGMVAVAWATPAAYALMAAVGAWQANRVYPVPFEWGRLAHLAAIVAALFFADRWLGARGWPPLAPATLGAKTALLLGFPVLLIVTGFFRHGEWAALRRMAPSRG